MLVIYTVDPADTNLRGLTLGLARLGRSHPAIDKICTFSNRVDKKCFSTVMDTDYSDTIQNAVEKELRKYTKSFELVGDSGTGHDELVSLMYRAMQKEENTKYRIWYDRDTYN